MKYCLFINLGTWKAGMAPSHRMSLASFANCESLSPQQEAGSVATSQEPGVTRASMTGSPKAPCPSQLAPDAAFEDEASLWDPEGDGPIDATKGHHVRGQAAWVQWLCLGNAGKRLSFLKLQFPCT